MDNISISLGTIMWICGAIVSISAAVVVVRKAIANKITSVTKDVIAESMKECSKDMKDKLTEISDKFDAFIKESTEADELARENMLANARYTINNAHALYVSRGSIDEHTLFTLEEVYKSYKKLGGNTFVDKQMNELRNLPIKINGGEGHVG